MNSAGRIPKIGEVVQGPGCEIRIQQANTRRIQSVTLKLLNPGSSPAENGKAT